jgi:hypothetical protein
LGLRISTCCWIVIADIKKMLAPTSVIHTAMNSCD